MSADTLARLVVWSVVGLAGCGCVIGGGLAEDWATFTFGLLWALAAIVMLSTGWWLRWPHE